MTNPTVQNTVTDASGQPVANQSVLITLVGAPAFVGSTIELAPTLAPAPLTNAQGIWSAVLQPNSTITPSGTYYKVVEPGGGVWYITVPNDGATHNLKDLLVTAPPSPDAILGVVRYDEVQALTSGQQTQAQSNLGLGSAALQPASAFDPAGAATTAANNALTLSEAYADRYAGSAGGTVGRPLSATDASVTNARTPLAHAATHTAAGSDPITITEVQVTNLTTDLAAKAPLASPALTGNPTAPTQTAADNSTKLATTAYADAAVGLEKTRAQNAEALLAPLASPALTGTPTAPTPTNGDNSTKIATTAGTVPAVQYSTQFFAASGSYTVPGTGTRTLRISCTGGAAGAPGGGSALTAGGVTTQVGGSGGGAALSVQTIIQVAAGTVLTVTIAAGGTGGAGGPVNGNAGSVGNPGGSTSVTGTGVSVTAQGGSPGQQGGANSTASTGPGFPGLQAAYGTIGGPTGATYMPGAAGQALNGLGIGYLAPLAPFGQSGGGGGCPANATNGGNGGIAGIIGGNTGNSSGKTATANGGNGSNGPANSGCGGGGGGGGAPGGTGGNGGNGGSGWALIEVIG